MCFKRLKDNLTITRSEPIIRRFLNSSCLSPASREREHGERHDRDEHRPGHVSGAGGGHVAVRGM